MNVREAYQHGWDTGYLGGSEEDCPYSDDWLKAAYENGLKDGQEAERQSVGKL